MLKRPPTNATVLPRNLRRERRLWHDSLRHTPSLGCLRCPERDVCGKLSVGTPLFDCLKFCCYNPVTCDKVCRNNPDFAYRVREIGGFGFETTSQLSLGLAPVLHPYIPVIYHGNRRAGFIAPPTAALSLYSMFNKRDGSLRYTARDALYQSYRIAHRTPIILTGTDEDPPLERWWGLGETHRRTLIRALRDLGITMATTPNYSLFADTPRWDDMHSMKRIQIVHREFLDEGLPAGLHVNGRTDTDFKRWTDYLVKQTDITHVAYEFATGTGWAGRREQHLAWLTELAANVGRPLDLLVRGGIELLPALATSFARVSLIDTSAFIKTMKRRRAMLTENGRIVWCTAPTAVGAPLDLLFAENVSTVEKLVNHLVLRNPRHITKDMSRG